MNVGFALRLSLVVESDDHDVVRNVSLLIRHHQLPLSRIFYLHDLPFGVFGQILPTVFDVVIETRTVLVDRTHRIPIDD